MEGQAFKELQARLNELKARKEQLAAAESQVARHPGSVRLQSRACVHIVRVCLCEYSPVHVHVLWPLA